jgi:hypothetical protein
VADEGDNEKPDNIHLSMIVNIIADFQGEKLICSVFNGVKSLGNSTK